MSENTDAEANAAAMIEEWDRLADEYLAAHADQGIDQIYEISKRIAGRRLEGEGGASLRMLLLRQKALVRRWVRQAFTEGAYAEWGRRP